MGTPGTGTQDRKRTPHWMMVALFALAGFLVWRMASVDGGRNAPNAANALPLQVGQQVAPTQASWACNTPDVLAQNTAFRVAGAEDKIRAQLAQHRCMPVLAQQRLKIAALKDKLAQVQLEDSSSLLWMPARDLVRVDSDSSSQ